VRRRRRPGRIFGIIVLVLVALIVGGLIYVDTSLNRVQALSDYSGRPASGAGSNWLIVGSDSRAGLSAAEAAKLHTGDEAAASGQRTDSMMVLHVPSNGTKPTLVSLLRDSAVNIPGHGQSKINAAYSIGGPQLLAKTVEGATGMRMDHYMEIGFGGFAGIVDDVGGVNMCLKEPAKDSYAGIDLKKGCQDLSGAKALGYVRSRHAFASGDYARTNHQREFIGALANKMASPSVFLNPFRFIPLMSSLPKALTVDESDHVWNLISVAWAMRGVSSGGVTTTMVPIDPSSGSGSDLQWDKNKSQQLFHAMNNDQEIPKDLIMSGGS
jgi:LCP family protein required for cell wall assembly